MDYTLDYCDKYMDEELDKMGSDYFPLPIKLQQFIKATFDFLRETTKFIEATQEISDDIKPLHVQELLNMTQENGSIWTIQEPQNYFRLISMLPMFMQNGSLTSKSKRVSIIKSGQYEAYKRDPNREPTHDYPILLRFSNSFKFDFGTDDGTPYSKAEMTFIKMPTFAEESQLNERIVDLPDLSIEKILDRATNSLRFITADSAASANYQFDQTFGKRKK